MWSTTRGSKPHAQEGDKMNIYAFSSLLASYVCLILGIYVYQKNPKNQLNRISMLLCVSLGLSAFTEFGCRQAADFSSAYMWLKTSSIWPFSFALLLHFVLVFTKKSTVFQNKATYFILYIPALIFFWTDLTTTLISGEPRKEYWGWTYSVPEPSLIYNLSMFWGILLLVLSLILCFLYFYRTREYIERQQAKYVFIGMAIPIVVGSLTDSVFPLVDIKVPELGIAVLTIGFLFIQYGIVKYSLFVLTPAVAAEDIVGAMSNVLFLVQEDGIITRANPAALHMLQCDEPDVIGQPLRTLFEEKEWAPIQKRLDNHKGSVFVNNEETAFKTKKGEIIPVLLSISAIDDKDGNNLGMVCVGSDLTDRKKAEESHKKDVLLKEIHHRVKNNMQIISSLLSLQSRYTTDKMHVEMIKESQNRIRSIGLIHEKLYQSRDLETIDFHEYISDIVLELERAYSTPDISVTIDVDNVSLSGDAAVPCGLIVNELVSNCFKHAFPDGKGEITVSLHAADGVVELAVCDTGVGIPDVDFRNAPTLGLRLVTILAETQLNGRIRLARDEGTGVFITFREHR
jgi:PAS domain S-box-containing protein